MKECVRKRWIHSIACIELESFPCVCVRLVNDSMYEFHGFGNLKNGRISLAS